MLGTRSLSSLDKLLDTGGILETNGTANNKRSESAKNREFRSCFESVTVEITRRKEGEGGEREKKRREKRNARGRVICVGYYKGYNVIN